MTEELTSEGYSPVNALEKINKLYEQLLVIFQIAKQNHFSTHQAAKSLGDVLLENKTGMRTEAPCFHPSL